MSTVPRQPPSPRRPGTETMATQPSRLSPGAQAKYHTEAEWKDMQPFISSMYASGMQQKELMGALAERGFPITPAQLKKRIRDWNLQRKVTKAEYLDLLRQTGSGVQKASVTKKGRPVAHRNLARASQRFAAELQSLDSDRDSTRSPSTSSDTMSSNVSSPASRPLSPVSSISSVSSRSTFLATVLNPDYPESADEEIRRHDEGIRRQPESYKDLFRQDVSEVRLHGLPGAMLPPVNETTMQYDSVVRGVDNMSLQRNGFDKALHDADIHLQLTACLDMWRQATQCYYNMRPKEVEQLQVQVVEWLPKLVYHNDPWLVSATRLLALSYDEQAKYAEAEHWHRVHLGRANRTYLHCEEHPEVLASQNHLATMFMHTKRYDEALKYAQMANDLQRLNPEADEFDRLYSLMTIGGIKFRMGRYQEAQKIFEEVKAGFFIHLGEDAVFTMRLEQEQARCLFESGDLEKAKQIYAESVAKQRRKLGRNHHEPLNGDVRLARVLTAKGECREAEQILLSVIKIYDRRHGREDPMTIRARLELADAYEGQGKMKAALDTQLTVLGDNDGRLLKCPWILKGMINSARRFFNAGGLTPEAVEVQDLVVRMSELQQEPGEVTEEHRKTLLFMRGEL